MDILLVAATAPEIRPLVERLKLAPHNGTGLLKSEAFGHRIDALITGVGMTATAYRLGRRLGERYYHRVLNLGVAGAFPPRGEQDAWRSVLEPGSVVHVVTERFGDLGAEAAGETPWDFHHERLDLFEMGLLEPDEFPFVDGLLANGLDTAGTPLAALPRVHGLTVNLVHGEPESIRRCRERYDPDVETMEGAAVFYACICEKLAFAEIRGISNWVEPRNREAWRLHEAVDRVCATAVDYLESLEPCR
jgi:futalosine hydrolase